VVGKARQHEDKLERVSHVSHVAVVGVAFWALLHVGWGGGGCFFA
jgi:hypothetical protein